VLKEYQELLLSPQKKSQDFEKKVKEDGESLLMMKANSVTSKDKDSDKSDNKLVIPQPTNLTTKDTMER
jgi:hypothetical protein